MRRTKKSFMNIKIPSVLIGCALLSTITLAQTVTPDSTKSGAPAVTISGGGNRGFLPKFAGPSQINDSNVFQSNEGLIGIGTISPTAPLNVVSNNPAGPPITMLVESGTDNAQGVIYAVASSPVGRFAVNGEAYFGTGVTGAANATTGPAVGVFGQAWSADGTAGLFANVAAGNISVGGVGQPEVNVFRVDGTGRVFADGGFQPNGADFAESMAVTGDRSNYTAGDLLVIDPSAKRHLGLAQRPYSTLVTGIYSTKPGMLGSTRKVDEAAAKDEVPLAVVGIAPCKVSAENGPIHTGDLLVASSTLGHAMKGTDRSKMLGAVVGKALEPLLQGRAVIQVLVTLQ
jgi:hypothetical protein